MQKKRIDPRQQFSKWLARSSALFLVFYLTALLVLIYFRPEAALYCVYLAILVSVVRTFDAAFYTKNSMAEKALLNALDKAKLEFSLKSMAKTIASSSRNDSKKVEEDPDEDEEDSDEDDETIKDGEG